MIPQLISDFCPHDWVHNPNALFYTCRICGVSMSEMDRYLRLEQKIDDRVDKQNKRLTRRQT
jgi:hypothetical protein